MIAPAATRPAGPFELGPIAAALVLAAMVGVAAVGTQLAFVGLEHREIQAVADASALAGASALAAGDRAHLQGRSVDVAANRHFENGIDGASMTINNPPLAGHYGADMGAVEVIVDRPAPWFLASHFGGGTVEVGGRAVAVAGGDGVPRLVE